MPPRRPTRAAVDAELNHFLATPADIIVDWNPTQGHDGRVRYVLLEPVSGRGWQWLTEEVPCEVGVRWDDLSIVAIPSGWSPGIIGAARRAGLTVRTW